MGGGLNRKSIFDHIISLENLLRAWKEFRRGKRSKAEVQEFEFNLERNLFQLHWELTSGKWKPDPYQDFYICDPKLRHIHKATVRDRVFNQAVFRVLYPIFDRIFIHDSYSCRRKKGTHRGVLRLEEFIKKITKNHTRPAFALKCDIRKFFDNIPHDKLFDLVKKKVLNEKLRGIIKIIIESFQTANGKGLPLGNVTSQLFANIYLNELDQFMKRGIKAKYYVRYCDDFIILDTDESALVKIIPEIEKFLRESLGLNLHPNKVFIRKIRQGIDFLGYVAMPKYRVLRTRTKKRIFRKISVLKNNLDNGLVEKEKLEQVVGSYLGMLTHCNGFKIRKNIEDLAGSFYL